QTACLVKVDVNTVGIPLSRPDANSELHSVVASSIVAISISGARFVEDPGDAQLLRLATSWNTRLNGPERTVNISSVIRNSQISLSSQQPQVFGINGGMITNGKFEVSDSFVTTETVGPRSVNMSAITVYLFSVGLSPNTLESTTLVFANISFLALVQFGDVYENEDGITNLKLGIVGMSANHNSIAILVANVEFNIRAVEYSTSAFSVLFIKALMMICYISFNSTNVDIMISNTSLHLSWPYYCTVMRSLVNSTLLTATTNGGVFMAYSGFVTFNAATVSNLNLTVEDGLIDIVAMPYKQDCPLARAQDYRGTYTLLGIHSNFEVTMVLSVLAAFLAILGVDPKIADFIGNLPSLLSGLIALEKFELSAVNVHVSIIRPRLRVNLFQHSIDYTSASKISLTPKISPNTVLRTGLVTILGVTKLHDLRIDTVLEDSDASTNSSIVLFDTVQNTKNLNISISRRTNERLSISDQRRQFFAVSSGDSALQQQVLMAQSLLTVNNSNVSGLQVEFHDLALNLLPQAAVWSGAPFPSILMFNNVKFLSNVVLSVYNSNITGYNRLVGGANYSFSGGATDSSALVLTLACNLWNGALMPQSKVAELYAAKLLVARVAVNDCPVLVPSLSPSLGSKTASETLTVPLPPPPTPPLSMSPGAVAVAAIGVVAGGAVSASTVMAMQKTIALLRLAKCDGAAAMEQELDIFTNPLGITINVAEDADDGSNAASSSSGSGGDIVQFGAAYRGAVVGNLAVFWCGGTLVAVGAVLAVQRWRRPLWSFGEAAEFLHFPGSLFSLLVSPLLQPVLGSALALLIHSRGAADVAIGVVGALCAVAATAAACHLVLPPWFKAMPRPVPHVKRIRQEILQLSRAADAATPKNRLKRL
ncbi:transmembrane protein, putative, partial [Bodo saltans]